MDVPQSALKHCRRMRTRLVLVALWRYAGRTNAFVFPSIDRLADDVGVGRRTVFRALAELASLGLIASHSTPETRTRPARTGWMLHAAPVSAVTAETLTSDSRDTHECQQGHSAVSAETPPCVSGDTDVCQPRHQPVSGLSLASLQEPTIEPTKEPVGKESQQACEEPIAAPVALKPSRLDSESWASAWQSFNDARRSLGMRAMTGEATARAKLSAIFRSDRTIDTATVLAAIEAGRADVQRNPSSGRWFTWQTLFRNAANLTRRLDWVDTANGSRVQPELSAEQLGWVNDA